MEFLPLLSFLNPTALIALFGIIAPIIIHIINQSRGKVVLIGRIEFLKKVDNLKLTHLNIKQWLLLLLRLLLIVLLALLFANLIYKAEPNELLEKKVFLTSDWLQQVNKNELKELLKRHQNNELYMLHNERKLISRKRQHSTSKLDDFKKKTQIQSSVSLAALIHELEQEQEIAAQDFIYLTNRASQFNGAKQSFFQEYQWRVKTLTVEARKPLKLSIDVYYSAQRAVDKQYLNASLEYLKQTSKDVFSINYNIISSGAKSKQESVKENSEWIIWLGDQKIPPFIMEQVKRGSFLLTDQKEEKSRTLKNFGHSIISGKLIDVFQYNDQPGSRSYDSVIWRHNSGASLLSVKNVGKGRFYRFYSRFHHDWNNLVEKKGFPGHIKNLLKEVVEPFEHKLISTEEILESYNTKKPSVNEVHLLPISLRNFLILLICVFWLLERVLSERSRNEAVDYA